MHQVEAERKERNDYFNGNALSKSLTLCNPFIFFIFIG